MANPHSYIDWDDEADRVAEIIDNHLDPEDLWDEDEYREDDYHAFDYGIGDL